MAARVEAAEEQAREPDEQVGLQAPVPKVGPEEVGAAVAHVLIRSQVRPRLVARLEWEWAPALAMAEIRVLAQLAAEAGAERALPTGSAWLEGTAGRVQPLHVQAQASQAGVAERQYAVAPTGVGIKALQQLVALEMAAKALLAGFA